MELLKNVSTHKNKEYNSGTPTSDEERTKIGLDTTHLLMIINGYSGLEGLEAAGKYAVGLLSKYVSAINMEAELVTAKDRTKIAL